MPRFYAAKNAFGSATDTGFDNTWNVFAFLSRETRDEWVAEHCPHNMSARAIEREEIGRYIGWPDPSSGKAFVIDREYENLGNAYGVVGIDVPQSFYERVD